MNENFANSVQLTGFIIQRERIIAGVWLGLLLLFSGVMSVVFETQFTPEELQIMLLVQLNPAQVALQGPVYGADNFLAGQIFAREMLLFTMIAVAVMNIFMAMRHTRVDEERDGMKLYARCPQEDSRF